MRISNRIKTLLIVFSIVATLCVMIYIIGAKDLKESILALSPFWIGIFFLIYIFVYLIRSYRWQRLLSIENKNIRFETAYRTIHITTFINSVTPARLGELARVYALKKEEDIPSGKTIAKITFEHILDFIAVLAFAAISLLVVLRTKDIPQKSYNIMLVSLVFIVTLMVLAIMLIFFGDSFISKTKRISEKLYNKLSSLYKHFREGMIDLSKRKRIIAQSFVLTLILWIFELLNIYIIAKAMSLDISIWVCIYAGTIAMLTLSIPLLPGGFGSYEAVLASLLVISGISLESALTLALIDHSLRFLYLLCMGPPFMIKTGIKVNKIQKVIENDEYIK